MGLNLKGSPNVAEVEGAGRRITLYDITNEPYVGDDGKPVTALIAGSHSKRYTKMAEKVNESAVRMGGRQTPEEKKAAVLKLEAVVVIEWDIVDDDGAQADVVKIFKEQPHIREQCIVAAHNHAAFFELAPAS